jgi:hypothetical protein
LGTFNTLIVNAKGQVTGASNTPYLTSEFDPDYNANGVKLAGAQTLTGVKTFPAATPTTPSIVVAPGSAYGGTTTGATWINSNHIYTYLNGGAQQLDNQASLGNVILNQTTLQGGANFNIDGAGKVGSLTFNTTPTSGLITDSVLLLNPATKAVEKIDAMTLSPFWRGPLAALSTSRNYIQLRNPADTLFEGSNNAVYAKNNWYGTTNLFGRVSMGNSAPDANYQVFISSGSNTGALLIGSPNVTGNVSVVKLQPYLSVGSGVTGTSLEIASFQNAIGTTLSGTVIGAKIHPQFTGTGIGLGYGTYTDLDVSAGGGYAATWYSHYTGHASATKVATTLLPILRRQRECAQPDRLWLLPERHECH